MHLITGMMNYNFSGLGFQALVLLFLVVWTGFEARAQNISTIAGNGTAGSRGDGKIATIAEIDAQAGAAIDHEGNVYIADFNGNRIRKINTAGIITTIAGTGNPGFGGDGGSAVNARLFGPSGIAVDQKGDIYFADSYNQRIRKISVADGGVITTIAGTGANGYSGNGGPAIAAKLQSPTSVAIDGSGNIYFSDCDNNCIRKINAQGIISAFAGNAFAYGTSIGSCWGDGKAAIDAELNHPKGIAVDARGNVYFADCFNHRIRKVNTNGIITTIAGDGVADYGGDSAPATTAQLNYPNSVAVDAYGNLYISDHGNNRIRQVNTSGIITTVVGDGVAGYGGDGGFAQIARINNPGFVSVAPNGNLYFGDNANNRIRMVVFTATTMVNNIVVPAIKMQPINPSHVTTN